MNDAMVLTNRTSSSTYLLFVRRCLQRVSSFLKLLVLSDYGDTSLTP